MYVNVNGKLTKVTREEYENMVEEKGKSPLTKMDELINAVLSVEEAISGGGGGTGDNTTYSISINGNIITLTGSDGSVQNIELPEVPGSILSQSWNEETKEYELTLTNGDTDSSVQIQYHLIKNIEANQIVLMAGDKPVDAIQLAQDQDTKYTIEKVGNEIRLIPSDGSAAIPIELDPDLNTTYELSFNNETDTLTLTPNDNSLPQNISLAKFADAEDVAKKADKEEIPDISGLATKTELSEAVEPLAKKSEIPDVSNFITADALQPYAKTSVVNEQIQSTYDEIEQELNNYAKTSVVTEELNKKADKSEIPDVSGLVTTAAMATALQTKADKSEIPDVSGFATKTELSDAVEPLAKKTDIPDVSSFITADALQPYATTENVDSALEQKADKTGLMNGKYVYNKVTTVDGYDLLWSEPGGGGSQEYSTKYNIVSFAGVNQDSATGVNVQLYAKYIADKGEEVKNKGSRLAVNPNGIYYTKNKTNGSFELNDEVVTLKDLPDISNFVTAETMNTALEGKLDTSTIIKNGWFRTEGTTSQYGTSMIWNEASGGGSLMTNPNQNVVSFAGVNSDTPDGVNVQLYAKFINNNGDQIKNKGSRLAVNTEGIYYTKNKTNGSFEANDEIVTLKDIDEVTVSFTEDLKNQNNALKAQIEMLNKVIKDIKYPEIENMDIDMDISASGKDIAISGAVSNVVRNISNASSVIAEDISMENARMSISADEDVEFTNMTTSGTLEKSVSNAAMSINNSGFVTIKDSSVAQNSYNAIEIGLSANVPPKNILIDNISFSGNLSNNAITVFGWQPNAEIVISNCTFDKCSNPIRLSNKTNVPAKVKFINCTCIEWDSNPDYAGFLLLQDYTSSSAEEAETANRFANIEITFENCYGPSGKIVGNAETLSDPTNQIIYIWVDKSGKVAYDASKFPKVNAY